MPPYTSPQKRKPKNFTRRKTVVCLQVLMLAALSASAVSTPAQARDVCDRTRQVRDKIVEAAGVESCEDVTSQHLSRITHLFLGGQGIRSLNAQDFSGLTSLISLELYNNQLGKLPAGVFSGLTNLERLELYNNQLGRLSAGIFSGLTNLRELSLNKNRLGELPDEVFSGLGRLGELHIEDHRLSTLPESVFSDLINLRELTLNRGRLVELPAEIFSGLSNLRSLDLTSNRLSELPDGVFLSLNRLDTLGLNRNQLTTLSATTFQGLSQLKALWLYGNRLSELPSGVFSGLTSLQHLYLNNNQLATLPTGVFEDLSDLRSLHLPGNRLNALPVSVFESLENLEFLSLSRNQLTRLPSAVFRGLGGLQDLRLHENRLTTLPSGVFAGLSNLQNLWLDGNNESFFEFAVEFELAAPLRADTSPAQVRLTLHEGAPGNLTIPLVIRGGTASPVEARLSTGSTQSEVVTVTRDGWGEVIVTATPSPPMQTCKQTARSCYRGFQITAGLEFILKAVPVLSLASTQLEVEEGGTAVFTVSSTLQHSSTLAVNYHIGSDNDEYTADADNEDYSTELVTIAPGSTAAVIRIPITDDGEIEPTSETFTVSLTAPGADAVYVLGSPATATVVIREGICDRTPAVQRVIIDTLVATGVLGDGDDCSDVSDLDLAGIQGGLNLINRGIESLKRGDFRGLGNVERLFLSFNNLSTLTAGVFEGLDGLQELYLGSAGLPGLSSATFRGLHNLQVLDLSFNPGLTALPSKVFSGLSALRSLYLQFAGLEELSAEAFSGLDSLESVSLRGNPGSNFQLTLKFERVRSLDRGSAEFRLVMREGAPFEMTVTLSAKDGTVSLDEVPLPRGSIASDTFEFSQDGSLPAVVKMSGDFNPPCAVCYSGLTVAAGSPYTLDEIGPSVSGVEFVSAPRQGDSYLVSKEERPSLRLAVSFDETVVISPSTDGPVLALGFDKATRMASYDPDSSSTDRLVFRYQLTMDDFDNDGVSIAEDALRATGATLKDAAGNAAQLGLGSHEIANAAAHKVYRQSELSLATTWVEVVEEGEALLTVSATPPPHVNLDVGYRLSSEGGVEDYSGPSAGSVSIPAGASVGTIRIPIKSDTVIESPREFFTVTLTPPSPPTAYFLASPATATVVVKEGICDRTQTVQLKILEKIAVGPSLSEALLLERCSGVDARNLANLTGALNLNVLEDTNILKEKDFEGLTGITDLRLSGNEISELPPGVFRGLTSLEELTLWHNELAELPAGLLTGLANLQSLNLGRNALEELPAGLFAGLTNLTQVWLHRNPGASFALKPRFEKVKPTGGPMPDVFRLRLVVDEGVPFVTTAVLTLQNATLSSMRVTIPTGSTASNVFTVTRHDADVPVVVYLNNPPPPETLCGLYRCYRGIEIGKPDPFDSNQANLRAVTLSVPEGVIIETGASMTFTVTTGPVLVAQEQVRVKLTVNSTSGFSFSLPDGGAGAKIEFSLSEDVPVVSVSVEVLAGLEGEADVTVEVSSTQNVVVNNPKRKFKLFSIPGAPSDNNAAGQDDSTSSTSMRRRAAPLLDSPSPVSASLVFSPSTRVQVQQGRSTTFGVSVSPALVLGEALSLRLAILGDENQAASGVTFAGSSSVRLTFEGGSPAKERQVPVSASATAVIGATASVFAAEVAALNVSYAGKSPLLELSVSTPRIVVSFTPEVLPPLEVGGSTTVSLGLRDDELQPDQQAKLRVQIFDAGWSVYPATVTLTAEAPATEVSLRASDGATFGVLRVTALEGVELLREAVLEVRAER